MERTRELLKESRAIMYRSPYSSWDGVARELSTSGICRNDGSRVRRQIRVMQAHKVQALQITQETQQTIRTSEEAVREVRMLIKQTGIACQTSTDLLDRQEESRLMEEIRRAGGDFRGRIQDAVKVDS